MCIYKLLKQDIANLRKLHLCQSRGTTVVNCNWFLFMWLYNLVSNSKIKSHSLHCSDFSPEWQPCACAQIYESYKGPSTFNTSKCISNQICCTCHTEKFYTSPKFKLLKLNQPVLFAKRNSMPERTWNGTHRYMKCKGVKNVENGSAARKSTDRTEKPTKRKQMMTRRLTYLELI